MMRTRTVLAGSLLLPCWAASASPSFVAWGGGTFVAEAALSAHAIATRIGAADGIPALNATDVEFIVSQQALSGAGPLPRNSSVQRRAWRGDTDGPNSLSGYNGPNSHEKWKRLKMDAWLEKYVNVVKVHGTKTLLRDSSDFFTDFWLSTGEESECSCATLLGSCNPTENHERAIPISRQDLLKAYFARQVFKVWQEDAKASYGVLNDVARTAGDMLSTLHRTVYRDVATPIGPTEVLDVLLPTLGIVTNLIPGLSTAAAILSAIEVSRLALVPRRQTGGSHAAHSSPGPQRQNGDDGVTAADVLRRVQQLDGELKGTQGSITYYTVLDKAAKTIYGFKALHRKGASGVGTWEAFDAEIIRTLNSFPHSVGRSFELNAKTWGHKAFPDAHASGMKALMQGGGWAKPKPGIGDITVAKGTIHIFFRRVLFMHFIKSQSIYLWREVYPLEYLCQEAALRYAEEGWIPNALSSHDHCFPEENSWVFLAARRPYKHKGSLPTEVINYGEVQFGDFIRLGKVSREKAPDDYAKGYYYVQERTSIFSHAGFDKASAWVDFWDADSFNAMNLELTPQQVYQLSFECAHATSDASGHDPWSGGPRNFYPQVSIKESDLLKPEALPKCLINIPIYQHSKYSADNEWCKDHVGSIEGGSVHGSYFNPRELFCRADHELLGLRADIALCDSDVGDHGESRVSRPGCQERERGVQIVRARWE